MCKLYYFSDFSRQRHIIYLLGNYFYVGTNLTTHFYQVNLLYYNYKALPETTPPKVSTGLSVSKDILMFHQEDSYTVSYLCILLLWVCTSRVRTPVRLLDDAY